MARRILTRYKICFQTKNKVWLYKDSRLRNFYKIRHPIILKQGFNAKQFLITKNMKWTVARRYMVPYTKTRTRFSFNYKNVFFNKQQLKQFYGGMKEYHIRNIFKKTWNVSLNNRRNIFISALEQRLSMVIFRMKLFPTIFACTQFINHKGVLVNNELISLSNYKVNIGDVVSIPEDKWYIFYEYLFYKAYGRYLGESLLIWRKELVLKKIQYYKIKNKRYYIDNLFFLDRYAYNLLNFKKLNLKLKKIRKKFKKIIKNDIKHNYMKKLFKMYKQIYLFFYQNVYYSLKILRKNLYFVRKWSRRNYNHLILESYFYNYNLQNSVLYVKLFLNKFFYIWNLLNKFYNLNYKINNKKADAKLIKNFYLIKNKKYLLKILFNGLIIKKFLKRVYKRSRVLKKQYKKAKYTRYIFYLLRKLKLRKKKRKIFKNWCDTTHWYVPSYLEVDYLTLRSSFINYPKENEVHYGFLCSFSQIISFFKERSL